MGTFDVTLPAGQRIVFPARCVVCEKPNPDSFTKLSFLGANSASFTEIAVDSAIGLDVDPKYYGTNTLNRIEGIPTCKGCASGLKWYHRLLKFGYFTGWIPGVILLLLGVPTFVSVIMVVGGAMSPGILTLVFPPSFGASFYNGAANFEFKSETTAHEFLRLNSEATLKKDAPKSGTMPINGAAETKEKL